MLSPGEIAEQRLQLKKDKFSFRKENFSKNKKFTIKNASVMITIIIAASSTFATVGAIYFQYLNYKVSVEQRKTAEISAKNDWNFRGVELFIKTENTIFTCNVPSDASHLQIFTYLFEDVAVKLSNVASARAQTCATASGNAASSAAKAENKSPEEIRQDAQKARYGTLKSLAAAASAPNTDALLSGQQSLPVIYVQISSESQRADAAKLQQAMRKNGYKVPGIELVSTAPAHAEVRYFYDNQSSEASTLAEFSKKTLDIPAPTTVSLEKTYQNLPSGVMEYWFPKIDSP